MSIHRTAIAEHHDGSLPPAGHRPRATARAGLAIWLALGGVVVGCLAACGGGSDTAAASLPIVSASASPRVAGCVGVAYPEPARSLYVLPWAVGESVGTGLTNCSISYHSAGQPDQFAFDFNMAVGTPFTAARGGTVTVVVNSLPSDGGGTGNYVVVAHGDGTSGLYLHSPKNGIRVKPGDVVKQGDVLGVTGQSGLAGYPHLHFMVVIGEAVYPYVGAPISFRNASPADRVLAGNQTYTALPY